MPASVIASGTQTCVVGTLHTLTTGTGPTGGGHFALALDTSALTAGQFLEIEVLRAVLSGGTERAWGGAPATVVAAGWTESPVFRVPVGIAYTVRIRQTGEAGGRAIPWSWERIDA